MTYRVSRKHRDYDIDEGYDVIRAKLRRLLDDAIDDETKAPIMYKELAEVMSEAGHNHMMFDIMDIIRDETRHKAMLLEIRKQIFGV